MNSLDPGTGLVLWQLIGILLILLYVASVVSVAFSRFKNDTHKLLWLLVVLAAPLLGGILYLALGRNYRAD